MISWQCALIFGGFKPRVTSQVFKRIYDVWHAPEREAGRRTQWKFLGRAVCRRCFKALHSRGFLASTIQTLLQRARLREFVVVVVN